MRESSTPFLRENLLWRDVWEEKRCWSLFLESSHLDGVTGSRGMEQMTSNLVFFFPPLKRAYVMYLVRDTGWG